MDDRSGGSAEVSGISHALPKAARLAKRAEFRRTYEAGRKSSSRFCVLFVSDNELSHARLGITATRKLGKAVVRNRLKRWIREIFRDQRIALGLDKKPVDFVLNLKPTAADASFREFTRDLTVLLRRLSAGDR